MRVMQIVVETLGSVLKYPEKGLDKLDTRERIHNIKTIALKKSNNTRKSLGDMKNLATFCIYIYFSFKL